MTVWVALLRGINLGSHNKVPMEELRDLAEEIDLLEPETYLRSGNLIAESDLEEREVAAALTSAIQELFGLAVPVICRSGDEVARISSTHPFSYFGLDERMLHVAFLDREPEGDIDVLIDAEQYEPDRFEAHGREVYLAYPNGSGRSKLNHSLLERRLGVSVTSRNWSTVSSLAGMVAGR